MLKNTYPLLILLLLNSLYPICGSTQNDSIRIQTWSNEIYSGANYQIILREKLPFYQVGEQLIPVPSVKYLSARDVHIRMQDYRYGKPADVYYRENDGPRIDLYTRQEAALIPYPQKGIITRKVNYYEKDFGPLQPILYQNLVKDLADNPASMERLRRARAYRTADKIAIGSALGLMVLAGIQTMNNGQKPSPAIIVTPLLLIVPLTTQEPKKRLYREAIEVYNR